MSILAALTIVLLATAFLWLVFSFVEVTFDPWIFPTFLSLEAAVLIAYIGVNFFQYCAR